MREEVEVLEHHADVGAQVGERAAFGGEGLPFTVIEPASTVSRRLMVRHSVDLPEPEGPMRTTTSPSSTVRSMSLSAWRFPKCLFTPAMVTIGAFGVASIRIPVVVWNPRLARGERIGL
nr:hypothetical protein GCM10025732_23600 [Glycomyces mayteni]